MTLLQTLLAANRFYAALRPEVEHRLKSLCATQVSRPVFRAGALQLAKGAG
jgi:hypothetical protein